MLKKLTKKQLCINLAVGLCMLACQHLFDGALLFGAYLGAVCFANVYFCTAIFAVCGLLHGASVWVVISKALVVLACCVVLKLVKRNLNRWLVALLYLVANVLYLIYQTDGYFVLFDKISYLLVGLAFTYVCIYTYRAVLVRGLRYQPALDEKIAIGLFVVVLSYALAKCSYFGYNALQFVVPFAILFVSVTVDNQTSFVVATLFGVGNLLVTFAFETPCLYVFMALACVLMNNLNRYVSAVAVVICDVLFAYLFDIYPNLSVYSLIPTFVSATAFCVVPSRVVANVADILCPKQQYSGRMVITKFCKSLSQRLYRLSDVFFAMKSTFVSMAMESVSKADAQVAIVKQVQRSVCGDCKQKNECWRNNLEKTEGSLLKLTECALSRGKVTILDISPTLTFRCDRLSFILSTINTHAESFLSFIKKSKETDGNRLLIGEQLGGVSQIMQRLATDCRGKIVFDQAKEKQIAEDLTFHNVLTKETVFLEQGESICVIVTVAFADYQQEIVEKIVSNVVKQQMRVEKVENTPSDKWISVYLAPKPRFNVTYGVASATKQGSAVSGDTHSFVNIGEGKVMFAVCDGMGSGHEAEKMSDTTIGLIENFYRAGFDNDVILNCVNKLLGSFNTDTFTAVDVCVVDLHTGLADFIKLGASNGMVKASGQVQYVCGSSLPMGILDEMKPSISTKALCDGDVVVLLSDGAWDSVGNADLLATVLSQTVLVNPQIIANDLLDVVLRQCKGQPKDDVTVLVARIST